jgi:nitroreductase
VSRDVIERMLITAREAPSGANLQPGRFILVGGAVRVRLTAALLDASHRGESEPEDYSYFPDPLPLELRRRQMVAARALYDAIGIARGDRAARAASFERNFRFFDAPVALVVTIDGRLGTGCYMDLGMCLYGLMLAAIENGVGSCAIGAIASFPSVVRRTLDIDPGEHVVCGFAIGHPDLEAPENNVFTNRVPLGEYFTVRE